MVLAAQLWGKLHRLQASPAARFTGISRGKPNSFWVRKDVFAPLIENVDLTLCSERYTDPLDAIEASLKVIYCTLENSSTVRQVYEIMLLRCRTRR